MTTIAPLPVLIVGSGRRIQNNFLPALSRIPDRLEPTWLWSRTPAHAESVATPAGVSVAPSISAVLPNVDAVIVSVSTDAVPWVLEQLAPRADQLSLVLDTPVFGRARHLPAMRHLRRFRKVLIAEDYARFPQWVLARRAVAAGLIGDVRSIELSHSGYRYHGLALIRSFLDWQLPRGMRRRSIGGETTMSFRFDDGRVASIIEPYDQANGTTTITGSKGTIRFSSSPRARPSPGDGREHVIESLGPDGMPEGFALGDQVVPLPDLVPLLSLPLPDRSVFNAWKTCGLLDVLSELWSPDPPTYDYRQALYDHLATAWLRHASFPFDPAAALRINLVDALDRAMSLLPTPRSSFPQPTGVQP
jgi:hypothetical protein